MAVPSDFEIASVIWTNLVVASTAFVVLHIAAFVFLASSMTRALATAIGHQTKIGEAWEQTAEKAREKFAGKVSDLDKRLKILRADLEAIPEAIAAPLAWRFASLHAVAVLILYLLGIITGLMGLDPSAPPLFLLVSISALMGSLILSVGFIIWIFLMLFRALKVRKP